MFYFAPREVAGACSRDGLNHANVRKILIVDDDAELRDAWSSSSRCTKSSRRSAVDSGTKGVQAAKAGQIDLVIMDVGLPDIDGREAVRILRKNGFKAPIIMLTGHDTDSDTILGLESGANDYVAKPFRFAVLLARIRAQLRQHEASEDAVFSIGPYTFRPSSKLLLNPKGNKVRLTEKETAILRYLYRAGQRPVSRETLLQEVWGYNSGVTTHTLETHIYRLRQKVEKDAANPAILVDRGRRLQAGAVAAAPMAIEDDIAFLERVPTLGLLGREALRILAIGAESRYVHGGEVLFNAGEDGRCGYVVQEGSFQPDGAGQDGDEGVTVGPGTLLGELALLDRDEAAGDRHRARAVDGACASRAPVPQDAGRLSGRRAQAARRSWRRAPTATREIDNVRGIHRTRTSRSDLHCMSTRFAVRQLRRPIVTAPASPSPARGPTAASSRANSSWTFRSATRSASAGATQMWSSRRPLSAVAQSGER